MRRVLKLAVVCALLGCRKPEPVTIALERLPTKDATVLSLDVNTLRQAGLLKLLAVSKTAEEPEYQTFVRNSGFDYQRDLDSALIAFAPSGTFFEVRGRFDWQKLEAYAQANGGSCYDKLCRMPGSQPERRISFLPIDRNLMALAVSTDDLAASRLTKLAPQRHFDIPSEPVWLSIPGASLRNSGSLPGAARPYVSALNGSDQVMLTLGPHGKDYEARLEVLCKSPEDARMLASQLSHLTRLLRDVLKSKTSDELPALLAAGSFSQQDRKVFGYWPVHRAVIETLAGI